MAKLISASQIKTSRVIDKQAVPVEIRTAAGVIEANIHVMINHRPSDVLNDETGFVALTEVRVTPIGGAPPEQHAFLALNKDSIIYLHER